jgi:hypothetical protein
LGIFSNVTLDRACPVSTALLLGFGLKMIRFVNLLCQHPAGKP